MFTGRERFVLCNMAAIVLRAEPEMERWAGQPGPGRAGHVLDEVFVFRSAWQSVPTRPKKEINQTSFCAPNILRSRSQRVSVQGCILPLSFIAL